MHLSQKLLKVSVKQIHLGAELFFELPFGMHPRIPNVLCMHHIDAGDPQSSFHGQRWNAYKFRLQWFPSSNMHAARLSKLIEVWLLTYLRELWVVLVLYSIRVWDSHIVIYFLYGN